MKNFFFGGCLALAALAAGAANHAPAYPLISIDPYTSVWLEGDTLNASQTMHWTNHPMPMTGTITVDGTAYRFMGLDREVRVDVAPHSQIAPWQGRYSASQPAEGWQSTAFDDTAWAEGAAPFGTSKLRDNFWVPAPGTAVEGDVWLRRHFALPELAQDDSVVLDVTYEKYAEVWVNGHRVALPDAALTHWPVTLPDSILNPLGDNVIAAHAWHKAGEYGSADFGVYVRKPAAVVTAPARQKSVEILPTMTVFELACGPVDLRLTFTAPLLPDDLELVSRPVNYIDYSVTSTDGQPHEVSLRFEASSEWATDLPGQAVTTEVVKDKNLIFGKMGSVEQKVLEKWGDDVRIDWGYFYLGGRKKGAEVTVAPDAVAYTVHEKRATEAKGFVMVAYDDIRALEYFGEQLPAYWNRDGRSDILSQLRLAAADHDAVMARCRDFDNQMLADARRAGGDEYADILAITFRQAMHAHKLLQSPAGELLYISKENFSNGSAGTVDLTYPSSPLFLLYNPDLLKGMMNPIFDYCSSEAWTKPFAAHDVGCYPKANGQKYWTDMPVEECGNMLVLAAAIARAEGNADYARSHWKLLTQWAEYLRNNGLDPANQLCTDDFAGHLAHNANLSVKAILGIASYGYLAGMLGDKATEKEWLDIARRYAKEWCALADDGSYYRLAFDAPGTWSMKYNLIWDKMLGFNFFPQEVIDKETAWYLTHSNMYGLPLDNREAYTKSDWLIWTAAMTGRDDTFRAIIAPYHRFLMESPERIPMGDWYWSHKPSPVYDAHFPDKGFRARSVVGGHFMKLLYDRMK